MSSQVLINEMNFEKGKLSYSGPKNALETDTNIVTDIQPEAAIKKICTVTKDVKCEGMLALERCDEVGREWTRLVHKGMPPSKRQKRIPSLLMKLGSSELNCSKVAEPHQQHLNEISPKIDACITSMTGSEIGFNDISFQVQLEDSGDSGDDLNSDFSDNDSAEDLQNQSDGNASSSMKKGGNHTSFRSAQYVDPIISVQSLEASLNASWTSTPDISDHTSQVMQRSAGYKRVLNDSDSEEEMKELERTGRKNRNEELDCLVPSKLDQWSCQVCTYSNPSSKGCCEMCGEKRAREKRSSTKRLLLQATHHTRNDVAANLPLPQSQKISTSPSTSSCQIKSIYNGRMTVESSPTELLKISKNEALENEDSDEDFLGHSSTGTRYLESTLSPHFLPQRCTQSRLKHMNKEVGSWGQFGKGGSLYGGKGGSTCVLSSSAMLREPAIDMGDEILAMPTIIENMKDSTRGIFRHFKSVSEARRSGECRINFKDFILQNSFSCKPADLRYDQRQKARERKQEQKKSSRKCGSRNGNKRLGVAKKSGIWGRQFRRKK